MVRTKSWAIDTTVDITVPTVADLPTILADADVRDGQGIVLQGYSDIGDGGGQRLIYRLTGKSLVTIDNGWYFAGVTAEGDDYCEAEDKQEANPMRFGAKEGDNAFDSQPAFQAAVNACLAVSSGGEETTIGGPELRVPGGIYYWSAPLVIDNNTADDSDCRLTIKGAGWESSVIEAFPGSTVTEIPWMVHFVKSGSQTGNRFWHIEGICFRGINGQTINGIDARKSAYFTIEKCSFQYLDTSLRLRNWTTLVRDCNFMYGTDQVVITDEPGIGGFVTINQIRFERCLFRSGVVGIRTAPGLDVNFLQVEGCQFDGSTRAAIVANGPIDKLTFSGNYLEAQGAGGTATVFKNRKGTKWEAGISYSSRVQVYDSAGNWWRRINTGAAITSGDDSDLGGGSDTSSNTWETLQWVSGYNHSAKDTVRDAAGNFWITIAGGVTAGNDSSLGTGSDSGVVWEPLTAEVQGAIVLCSTMTNTSGPQGEITDNALFNCNFNSAMYIEGCQQLTIKDNRGSGSFANIFCTVGNTMKPLLGPLSPYQTSDVVINHNRWTQTGNEIWRKIVHFETTSNPADGNCGLTIIDRSPKYYTTYPIVLNDLANPKTWKQDASYVRPRREPSITGLDEVTYPTSGNAMSTVAVIHKRFGGPLSRGGYLKLFGKSFGDDGTANVKVIIHDGYRGGEILELKELEVGHEGFSKEPVVPIEPCSPYRDWEVGKSYSIGDLRRSAYNGREYRCISAYTSAAGDDRNMVGTGKWAETARSASNQGRAAGEVQQPFDWEAGVSYQIGEIVQSNGDGEWYSADTFHTSAGTDDDLDNNSDTGGNWTKLDRDPTLQPVIIHVYDGGSSATNVTIKDFAICSASYPNELPPTITSTLKDNNNELNMADLSWAPVGTHKWHLLDGGSSFEQGEVVTWSGGSARLVWLSVALNDHMIVRDLIGAMPLTGTTITGQDTGATVVTTGSPRTADTTAFYDTVDEAARTGKAMRIPAGTYALQNWGIKQVSDDVTIICDDGAILDVGDNTLSFMQLDAATTSSFTWIGGEVRNAKRFLYLPRVDGGVTDSIHIERVKFVNVLHVIEDAAATTAGVITHGYFGNLDIDDAEEAFYLQSQQFTTAVFEGINFHDFTNPVQISAITIGNDVGADQPSYGHGSVTIRDCVVTNMNNAATSSSRGFRLYGDNITVQNCKFNVITNTGSLNEAIYFASNNGSIRDCRFVDASKSSATITIAGPYVDGVTISGCRISRTDAQSPVAIDITADDCVVENNVIANGGPAVQIRGDRNIVIGNSIAGAHLNGSARDTVAIQGMRNRVSDNTVVDCGPSITTVYGITMHSTNEATNHNVVSNNVVGNLQATTNNFGIAMVGSANGTNNTNVSGNHLYDLDRGIYVTDPGNVDGVFCSGNSFSNTPIKGLFQSATNVVTGINNYAATSAPGVGDDTNDGYGVGSLWHNVTADDSYVCLDATLGAAVWKKTTP